MSESSATPSNPVVVWLQTAFDTSTNTIGANCENRLEMDASWTSQFLSTNYVPAAVANSPLTYASYVVALHGNNSAFSSVILISSEQFACDASLDTAELNNADRSLQLEVIEMQMYATSTLKILMLDHSTKQYILLDNLVVYNGLTSIYTGLKSSYLSWNITSKNTASFTLSQSNINVLLLPQTAKNPIALGSSSLYYTDVTDGFMLRDQGNQTCLEYLTASSQLDLYNST